MGLDFEAYVRSAYPRLCRYAVGLCGDHQQAEDLVQTALARCWPALRRGVDNPDAYVVRAIVNTHRTSRRRFWHRETPTSDLPDTVVAGDDAAGDDTLVVRSALRALSLAHREVLVLRFLADLSEAETARLLGVSVGTVKSRTARAVAALRGSGLLAATAAAEREGGRHV